MNEEVLKFARSFRKQIKGRILEVGSRNVNGSLRSVLKITVGVDIQEGQGVDVVLDVNQLVEHFGAESFDHVCSTDTLEHIQDWRTAVEQMWGVLKPGGVLLLTMAAPTKGRHAYPDDYWRMELPVFLAMFGENTILGHFCSHVSLGAAVVKSSPLALDFEPDKVP